MVFATAIPVVPDGSSPVYGEVERFLLDQHEFLEIGGHKVRSFKPMAGHLTELADDVEELIGECVDAMRNAKVNEADDA